MSLRVYSDTAPPTVLTANLGNSGGDVSIQVGSTSGYPAIPGGFSGFIGGLERGTLNEEVVLVTAIADGTHFTVVRGYNGTPINNHDVGSTFEHTSSAVDYSEPNIFINLIQNQGDLIIGGSGGVPQELEIGASGLALVSNGTTALWQQVIPVAVVQWTAATTAPVGFHICDGSSQSTTDPTFVALFAAIGYTYGGSGGSFNLPQIHNKFVIGGGSGSSYALASTGGSTTSTIGSNNLPTHIHPVTVTQPNGGAGHSHNIGNNVIISIGSSTLYLATAGTPGAASPVTIDSSGQDTTNSPSGVTAVTGNNTTSNTGLAIVPPYIALTPIIKL